MRVLHVLDHSIPLSGAYVERTMAVLRAQRAIGWETFHLTGPAQPNAHAKEEVVDTWHFFRTLQEHNLFAGIPGLSQLECMGEITYRLERLVKRLRPNLLHAHAPVLLVKPAIRVGHRLGLPVVYEVQSKEETNRSVRRYSFSHWLLQAMERSALRQADALVTSSPSLHAELLAQGLPASTLIFVPSPMSNNDLAATGQIYRQAFKQLVPNAA